MNNALKEINNVFDVGDTYRFELQHIDNSGDPNLQKLVDLILMIEMTVDAITNVNEIDPSELDHE